MQTGTGNDRRSPKSMEELRLLRKSVNATKRLTCEVAGIFNVNLGFMLNFYDFVVDSTVNAILVLSDAYILNIITSYSFRSLV